MGLDAVVFRRGGDDLGDPSHVAAEARLGNIAMIGELRSRVEEQAAAGSLLLERVLYSATHSGDEIAAELVAKLTAELQTLRCEHDPELREFRDTMLALAQAALSEGAAISFV